MTLYERVLSDIGNEIARGFSKSKLDYTGADVETATHEYARKLSPLQMLQRISDALEEDDEAGAIELDSNPYDRTGTPEGDDTFNMADFT